MATLKSIKAKERWAGMTEEEREKMKEKISKAMRSYWKAKSVKERSEVGKRAAATRRANAAIKLKLKGDAK